jgi:hypothetical protein
MSKKKNKTPCTEYGALKGGDRLYDSAQKYGGELMFLNEGAGTVTLVLMRDGVVRDAVEGIRENFVPTLRDGLGLS